MSSLDPGISDYVFGKDLLSQHNMKPWWETLHGYLLATTITSSLFMLYAGTYDQLVSCLPTKFENTTACSFTDPQAQLTDGYCQGQIPWFTSYAGIISFAFSTVILFISNIWLNHPEVIDGFRSFSKAEQIINQLHSRSKTLNEKAIAPVFSKEGEAFELRNACSILRSQKSNVRRQYSIRNSIVIAMSFLALSASAVACGFTATLINNPHFYCSLSDEVYEDLEMSLSGHREFFCSYNFSRIIFPFLLICGLTLAGQILALGYGWFQLRRRPTKSKTDTVFSADFVKAKEYMSFMKMFWLNAQPLDSERFESLIVYIFTEDAVISMIRHIRNAIINGDTRREERDVPAHMNAPKYQNVWSPNPDFIHIQTFVKTHRRGGNVVLGELYKLYKNTGFGISATFDHFKFTHWDEEAKSFVKHVNEKKHWSILVQILNAFQDNTRLTGKFHKLDCGVYDFELVEKDDSERSKSVLYYALQKLSGTTDFELNAISHVLACTKGVQNKCVLHRDKYIPATEFVQIQYDEDPTYSETLRDRLIDLIKESENPTNKFLTTTVDEKI